MKWKRPVHCLTGAQMIFSCYGKWKWRLQIPHNPYCCVSCVPVLTVFKTCKVQKNYCDISIVRCNKAYCWIMLELTFNTKPYIVLQSPFYTLGTYKSRTVTPQRQFSSLFVAITDVFKDDKSKIEVSWLTDLLLVCYCYLSAALIQSVWPPLCTMQYAYLAPCVWKNPCKKYNECCLLSHLADQRYSEGSVLICFHRGLTH